MRTNRDIWKFRFAFFLHGINSSAVWSFLMAYFIYLGMSNTQMGFLLAITGVPPLILTPIAGLFRDHLGTVKKIFCVYYILEILSVIMFFKVGSSLILIGIFFALYDSINQSSLSLLASWVLENPTTRNVYSTVYAFDTLGWGSSAYLVGKLIGRYGYPSISPVYVIIGTCLLIYASTFIKDAKRNTLSGINKCDEESKVRISWAYIKEMITNIRYLLLVGCMTLVQICFYAVWFFAPVAIEALKGTVQTIGLYFSIQAIFGFCSYFMIERIQKKFGMSCLLIIGSAVMILKCLTVALATSLFIIQASAFLQLLTVPVFFATTVQLLYEIAPSGSKGIYQISGMCIITNVSAVVATAFGGYLADTYGLKDMFLISCVVCAVGAVLSIGYYVVSKKMENINENGAM